MAVPLNAEHVRKGSAETARISFPCLFRGYQPGSKLSWRWIRPAADTRAPVARIQRDIETLPDPPPGGGLTLTGRLMRRSVAS
jgi:hypothetical protein